MKFSRTPWQPLAAALLALAPLTGTISAQTTATTTPVGFITVTIPGGNGTDTTASKPVSVPLYNAPAFAGAIASVDSANSLTVSGAAWTAGQFVSSPHILRVRTGAQVGKFYLITANTTTQVTVDVRGGTLSGNVGANDTCEIIPANTLGSLFGTTSPIVQTGASVAAADNVFIYNGTSFDTFFHNGTNWVKSGAPDNQNGFVLYPDEGLIFARRATTPLTLTMMGTVPSGTERSDLEVGSTLVANRFPVDIQLGSIGFQSTTGWVSGPTANSADKVLVWNGTNWETYYYNGTNWRKAGNGLVQDTTVIPAGTAVFVTRAAAAVASLAQALPYTP